MFESSDAAVVRRNPWIMGLAVSPLAVLVVLLIAAALGTPQALVLAPHCLLFATVFGIMAWRRNPRSRRDDVHVRADAGGLTLGGRRVPRKALRDGFILPRDTGRPWVHLRRGTFVPSIDIEVADGSDGRRLLRALRFDASQSVASFLLPSRIVGHPFKVFGAVFGLFFAMFLGAAMAAAFSPLFAAAPLLFLVCVLLMLLPTRLYVGADGLLLSWLWRKRFIPHAAIEDVSSFTSGFGRSRYLCTQLLLKSGKTVRIPVAQQGWDNGMGAIVPERIREAMDVARLGGTEVDAALLQREGRDVREWMASLRSIGAGANASLRTAPILPERLWRLVEDSALPPATRAAAAVALGADLDDEGRSRLRAAAEAVAAPRLRVAIERVAGGGSEDELAEALTEIQESEEAGVSS